MVVTTAVRLRARSQAELRLNYLFSHATCQGSPDVALGQTRVEIYAYGCKMDMNKGLTFLLKVDKQYKPLLFSQMFGLSQYCLMRHEFSRLSAQHLTLARTFKSIQEGRS